MLQQTSSISKDALKSWCKGRKVRALWKLQVCEKIVDWKVEYKQNPHVEPTYADMLRPACFNTLRFINVIFGPVMKIKISLRGQVLSASDLEEGKKNNQDLFAYFIRKYKDKENASYSHDDFPRILHSMDGGEFTIMSPED